MGEATWKLPFFCPLEISHFLLISHIGFAKFKKSSNLGFLYSGNQQWSFRFQISRAASFRFWWCKTPASPGLTRRSSSSWRRFPAPKLGTASARTTSLFSTPFTWHLKKDSSQTIKVKTYALQGRIKVYRKTFFLLEIFFFFLGVLFLLFHFFKEKNGKITSKICRISSSFFSLLILATSKVKNKETGLKNQKPLVFPSKIN